MGFEDWVMKKIITLLLAVAVTILFGNYEVKAYSPAQFVKTDPSVTDISVNAFGTYYDTYVPLPVKKAYEADGGMFYIIPHNYVRNDVNVSGWNGGNLSNVTGFLDPNGVVPVIYLNSKTVDNSDRYKAGTDSKVIIHELGHYVNLKANQIRNGNYSYDRSSEMEAAFKAECENINLDTVLPESLHDSFVRNSSSSEFYANIFAGLLIDPVNTQMLFPLSSEAVRNDYATIAAVYSY